MGTIVYVDGFDDYTIGEAIERGWSNAFQAMYAGRVAGQRADASTSGHQRDLVADAEYSIGFAWWAVNPTTAYNGTIVAFQETNTVHGVLRYNADGTFSILRNATVLATSATQVIVAATPYHLEFDYKVHDSTGSYELRFNGVAIIGPTTGVDTRNVGTNGVINQVLIQSANGAAHYHFDDLVITKGGGFQGDCRVITQYPDANGTNTAWAANGGVAYQAIGSRAESTTTVAPAWPAHQPGDVAILLTESCGGEAVSLNTANGFVECSNSPQATGSGTNGTRLHAFWCRATSSSMSAPVTNDPGDHVSGVIVTFRGCPDTGTPFDVLAGGVKAGATTALTITGANTTINGDAVMAVATHDLDTGAAVFSGWTNANLSSLTERFNGGGSQGNGGGLGIVTGNLATAGATGDVTASCTSSTNAFMIFGILPAQLDYEM